MLPVCLHACRHARAAPNDRRAHRGGHDPPPARYPCSKGQVAWGHTVKGPRHECQHSRVRCSRRVYLHHGPVLPICSHVGRDLCACMARSSSEGDVPMTPLCVGVCGMHTAMPVYPSENLSFSRRLYRRRDQVGHDRIVVFARLLFQRAVEDSTSMTQRSQDLCLRVI